MSSFSPSQTSSSSSSSYALGVLFLVIVSLLWTACSMVVQHLYNDMSFDSPFLIVYIGTSLFSVFLPSRLGYERWGHRCLVRCRKWRRRRDRCCRRVRPLPLRGGEEGEGEGEGGFDEDENDDGDDDAEDAAVIIPWRNRHGGEGGGEVVELMRTASRGGSNGRALEISDGAEDGCHNEPTSDGDGVVISSAPPLLSHLDHVSMASRVAPLWFLSNYSYAVSLRWTSIASSTVLASMGSIFAFAFATCTRFGDEKVTRWKVVGVALCFVGGVATAWTDVGASSSDGDDGDNDDGGRMEAEWFAAGGEDGLHRWRSLMSPARRQLRHAADVGSLLGDIAGLISAVGYGAYTVLLRHLCPKDESRMSMQLLFGYVGLLNMIGLFPVAVWVIVASNRDDVRAESPEDEGSPSPDYSPENGADDGPATTLTLTIFLFLILKGLLDNVISDYLWARAVILTSATVASVGLGLTIPMAFLADSIMGNNDEKHLGDLLGALCVLFGFVFVNIDGKEKGTGEVDVGSEVDVGTIDIASVVHDAEIRPSILS